MISIWNSITAEVETGGSTAPWLGSLAYLMSPRIVKDPVSKLQIHKKKKQIKKEGE